jgi:hypothetical protein
MESITNQELQLAFDFVKYTNRNIFLTGKAGTGKTTFLHNLKKTSPKRMIVVAPTGVAAINAGGVTIHSFFQLPFHPFIPTLYLPHNNDVKEVNEGTTSFKVSREKVNIIKSLDLVVIDEISMVRADLLDAIDSVLRRYRNHNLPFGGVQLLMIGDLHQLAPVVKDEDREFITTYYDSPYFYGSRALGSTDYVTIELKHIYRQNDQVFIDLLNKVRDNKVDSDALDRLNKRYIPDFDPDTGGGYITLTTHNAQAKLLNDSKLEKLPSASHTFSATITDEFPEFSYPADNELVLKKGAQVMFVKNDLSGEKLFFNGKIGKVVSFDDGAIIVRCPGDPDSIRVEVAEWQNMKYSLDDETKEIRETVIGTFRQYPLRLAWAITIHKSQGLTFERAVIDAKSAFAHGQVYVALSRCRTLEGLVLSTQISQRSIIDDHSLSAFIRDAESNQPGPKELAESRRSYQGLLLAELFDFTPIERTLSYSLKLAGEHRESLLGNPKEFMETAMNSVRTDLISVSEKFRPHLKVLLNRDLEPEHNPELQERVQKAVEYFSGKLDAALEKIMTGFSIETDNKAVRKAVTEAVDRVRKESIKKSSCLNAVRSGFTTGSYLEAKAKSEIESPREKTGPAKKLEDATGKISHPVLFQMIREWRNDKAGELDLPHYMILPQKTIVTLTNKLPQTIKALRSVKGIGTKKALTFGEELLEIITSYCRKENIEVPDESLNTKIVPRKAKEDTRLISCRMYQEGRSVAEIASERKISENTVVKHLSHYVESGEIQLHKLVPEEIRGLIFEFYKDSDDLSLAPAKEELGDRVSWNDLRFVVSHIKFLRKHL